MYQDVVIVHAGGLHFLYPLKASFVDDFHVVVLLLLLSMFLLLFLRLFLIMFQLTN